MSVNKASKKRRLSSALSELVDKIMDSSDDEELAAGSQRRLASTPSPRRAPTTPPSRRAYQPDPTAMSTRAADTFYWTSSQPDPTAMSTQSADMSYWTSNQPAPLPERWAYLTPDYATQSAWPPAFPPPSPIGSVGQASCSWTPSSPTNYAPPRVSKVGKVKRKALPASTEVPHRARREEPEAVAVAESASRRPSKRTFKVSQKCIVL